MFIVDYRATERGIRERNANTRSEERRSALRAQRALYEAKMEEAAHIAAIRRAAAERAEAMAAEMKSMGYKYRHTYREIERRACKLFKVRPSDIRSARRHNDIVIVRQFICYWTCRLTALSLPQIGRLMDRDHTSILAAKRRYPQKRERMGRNLQITN